MMAKKRLAGSVKTRAVGLAISVYAGCVLLASCGSPTKSIALAKESVDRFHSQLDFEQYSAIYAAADGKLHAATTEADFIKLLQAIHRKLGNVQNSSLKGENISWYAGQGRPSGSSMTPISSLVLAPKNSSGMLAVSILPSTATTSIPMT
jgi:hypothetical protein